MSGRHGPRGLPRGLFYGFSAPKDKWILCRFRCSTAKAGNNTAWWLMSDMVVPSLASIGYWTNGAIAGLSLSGNVRAANNYSNDGGGPLQSFGLGAAGAPNCVNTTPTKPVYNINATETGGRVVQMTVSSRNRCGLVLDGAF